MSDELLEPREAYNKQLKDKHLDETIKYFDELTNASGVDVAANQAICKEYYRLLAEKEAAEKSLKKVLRKKHISCFFMFLLAIVGLLFVCYACTHGIENTRDIVMVVCGPIMMVVGIVQYVIVYKKTKPILAGYYKLVDDLEKAAKQKLDEAYASMLCLNNLYDWNIPAEIINRTNGVIRMEENFSPKSYQYLHEKFGLDEAFDDQTSTEYVQAGNILGNPFMICKNLRQSWYQHRYWNSITIHWTTVQHTKNGTQTIHHSQTLTAEVYKPAPQYGHETILIYGNDAAPNLIFSRGPSGATGKNEKQIVKMVRKEAKELDKKARKELMDDDPTTNYTRFGNDEFESLFGGTDRNNEMEYRLLFTPLAQRNLIKLIKEPEPYGDDFSFRKHKKINVISSRHSQTFDYRADPKTFLHFDYEKAKELFINYNVGYFKSFFFDLAPLISIPLYQQMMTQEYIYEEEYEGNVTLYESEAMANQFDVNVLKHPQSDTINILKARLNGKKGQYDDVTISAYGYNKIEHVEYIDKLGGDGHVHTIPVTWYEYAPVTKETQMVIEPKASSRNEWINKVNDPEFQKLMTFAAAGEYTYERGLFAALVVGGIIKSQMDDINKNYAGCKSNISNNSNILNNSITGTINRTFGDINAGISQAKAKTTNSNIGNSNNSNSNNQ